MSLYWSKTIVVRPEILCLMLVPSRCFWEKCTPLSFTITPGIRVSPDHKCYSPPHRYSLSTVLLPVFATLWHSLKIVAVILPVLGKGTSFVLWYFESWLPFLKIARLTNTPVTEEKPFGNVHFSQAWYWAAVVVVRPTAHFTQSLKKLREVVNGFLQHTEQVNKRSALH